MCVSVTLCVCERETVCVSVTLCVGVWVWVCACSQVFDWFCSLPCNGLCAPFGEIAIT